MAKKKKQDTPARPAEFRTTPFSKLKGVAVAQPAPEEKPAPPPPPPAAPDDAALFLEAMQGVSRVQGKERSSKERAAPTGKGGTAGMRPSAPALPVPPVDPAERETFAQAIGQLKLDVTFTENIPDEEELKPLGANRLRQLKRGVITVDRQLDLHGLTREEALEALPRFLKGAAAHGEKAVLVITGKGNNSPAEPVLQQAVAGWLRDAGRTLVVEFAPAPREMGGSGAFVVFMRS